MSIAQPTLSHHMKILSDCNLVKSRKDGKWSHYSLNYSELKEVKDFISELKKNQKKTVLVERYFKNGKDITVLKNLQLSHNCLIDVCAQAL